MCKYSNLYSVSGKNAFPSKQFLPLGPLASALFVHLLLEAMRRMKMEAKAHENERRVQLIIIEEKGRSDEICIFEGLQCFCTLSQSHTGIISMYIVFL